VDGPDGHATVVAVDRGSLSAIFGSTVHPPIGEDADGDTHASCSADQAADYRDRDNVAASAGNNNLRMVDHGIRGIREEVVNSISIGHRSCWPIRRKVRGARTGPTYKTCNCGGSVVLAGNIATGWD